MTNLLRMISIAAALCLGLGSFAQAQTLKKYITPEGKTVYSDTPVPGAKEVGEIKPQPMLDPASRSRAQDTARKEAEDVKAVDKRLEDRAAQSNSVAAAEAKLEEAMRTLKEGKEPLPGERIGTVSGQSRLKDEYWSRQKANQQAVDDAQKVLDAARATR